MAALASASVMEVEALLKNAAPFQRFVQSYILGIEVIKLFMLILTEHEIMFPAYKCKNANNCRHFNIYYQDEYNI